MGRIQTLQCVCVCVWFLYKNSLGSWFSTLLLWERLYPELLKGPLQGAFLMCTVCCTELYGSMWLLVYLYTHTHCPLCWPVRPKAGCIMLVLTDSTCLLWISAIFFANQWYLFRTYTVYWELTPFSQGFTPCGHKLSLCCVSLFVCPGPEQTSVSPGRHPDTWWLLRKTAAEQPALRPAAEPTLPQSITGERERKGESKRERRYREIEGYRAVIFLKLGEVENRKVDA